MMLLLCALIAGSTSVWAVETSYTITFKESGTESDNSTKRTTIADIISEGAAYVSSISNPTNVYNARNGRGIKLGTSKANGSLTLNLATTVKPTKITFFARQYNENETSITVNGKEVTDLTANFVEYTKDYDGNTAVSSIAISTPSLRAYITKVTVYYEDGGGSTKADPELSFAEASYNATYGEEFTPPTLNHAAGFTGTVEYTSSDESVAWVSDPETGELRINKGGTTTITATFAGDNAFNAGSASYTLIVTDNRIATTITQENIELDIADVATLTRLTPVVKDASGNEIEYTNSLSAEGMPDVFFDIVADDNGMFGSFDSHGNIILNSVTGTATVKAVYNYFNTVDTYQPSECTFTITVISPLDNIAALTAKTDAGTYKVKLSNAVVTFVSGNYAYIQDASGAVAMYKSGHGLNAGHVFNGTATVAYQLRNQNPQITDLSGVEPVAESAPNPTEVAQSAWNYTFEDVLSQYFKVTGATITQSNSKYYINLKGDNVQLFKSGGSISSLNLSKKYTITGFPTLYNTTKELQIFVDPAEEASSDPAINADNVTIEYDATSGEISYTIDNPTGATLSAALTDGEWIDNITVTADKVTFTATANTGAQRTATITLSYTGAEDKVITITQKACVVATLPFAFDGGRADVDNTPGLTQTGLGSDYNSSPKLKFDGTGDELILRINENPGALTFDIKGNGFSDGTFKVQTSVDGTNYEDLVTYTKLGATQTELFNLLPNVRYIKWVYTGKVNGNVALGNINLKTKYAAKIGSAGYTTFCSMRAHDFTGVTAYVVSAINTNSIVLTEITSAPANTPVLLKAEEGYYELDDAASPAAVGTNLLEVSDGTVKGNGKIYVLAKVDDNVRFYKLKNDSPVPAGKAYLQVDGTNVPEFLDFEENITGIDAVRGQKEEVRGEFYNLAGQRVAQPTKGLYIVNGKKIVIK